MAQPTGSPPMYIVHSNMTKRVELSGTQLINYEQGWDADNRLVVVTNTVSGEVSNFTYDADGQRVKRTDASGTTVYIGAHFEVQVTAGISTSYYVFGGQRVAMRQGNERPHYHGTHGEHIFYPKWEHKE